jgi:predicted ferric reductase
MARRYGRSMSRRAIGGIGRARGWIALAMVVVTPVFVWATARPLDSRFSSTAATLGSLANITGLAAIATFAANLVMGSRLKPIARLFGGLEAMYGVHRRVAVLALALALSHAMLAAGHAADDSASGALRLFLPAAGWAVFAGSIALALLAGGLALTFFAPLTHERFVLVQRALGLTFAIAAVHAFGVPGVRSSTPLLLVLGALTAVALAAFARRSLLATLLARRHRYVVAAVNRLDEWVVEIRMQPVDRGVTFMPGQFIFVSFRSGAVGREPHPYSIASSPQNGRLDIVVKALGDHTAALKKLTAGTRADIEGPYGTFSHLNVPNVRQIWIAGGIGVTPLLSMARSLDGSAGEIDFFYCTEGPEHAHFLDELYAKADLYPQFRVVPIRSRSLGRIGAQDIIGVSRPIEHDAAILICGPPAMIQNLATQFMERGIPRNQLYFEDFSFLGPPGSRRREASAARAAQ